MTNKKIDKDFIEWALKHEKAVELTLPQLNERLVMVEKAVYAISEDGDVSERFFRTDRGWVGVFPNSWQKHLEKIYIDYFDLAY